MTQPRPARVRHCPDCHGFSLVAIDTGTLLPDGTRRTLRVACPACHGTGTTPVRPRPQHPAGSRA